MNPLWIFSFLNGAFIMKSLFSIAAAAALIAGAAGAATADPIYEAKGVPITPHQLGVLASVLRVAHLEEQAPLATLMAGMPASPHQVAILGPRPTEQQIAARPAAD
jgi:phosphoribosylcarboxyaminoimidazole (NCAIR) mutase